jgi:hypothetical protein
MKSETFEEREARLLRLRQQLDHAQTAHIEDWEEQTAANLRRPHVESQALPDAVERAKRWATIVSIVGGAIVAVIISYYQQRAALPSPPSAPRPEVNVTATPSASRADPSSPGGSTSTH